MNIISFNPTEDPRNINSYRREKHFDSQLSLIDLDKGREIACVRFYRPDEVVYCVVWIDSDKPARGYGKAGDGYHKRSAAMGEALARAGVVLSEPINGCGDSAMDAALEALAHHMGAARPLIVGANA